MKRKKKLPQYVVEKNGEWHVRRNFPTHRRDAKGHIVYLQVTRRCCPHTEEQAKLIAAEIELQHYTDAPRDPHTVEDFIKGFLSAKQGSVESRTYQDYKDLFERYVVGTSFGASALSEVSPQKVQAFYGSLTRVSGQMIRKLNVLLSMSFNQGVRWEVLTKNPCKGVILPRPNPKDIEIMSAGEAKKFMKVCRENPLYYVLAFALETFMRPEEYLSLQWSNVKGNTVSVTRAITYLRGGGYQFKVPKTKKSRRTIEISPVICELLQKHKENQEAHIKKLAERAKEPLGRNVGGVNYQKRQVKRALAKQAIKNHRDNDLIFPAKNGAPYPMNNLGRREMKDACSAAGIPAQSLYALRHTGITLALSNGADIKEVSEKAGHASINITLGTYFHVLPVMRTRTTEILSEALYG